MDFPVYGRPPGRDLGPMFYQDYTMRNPQHNDLASRRGAAAEAKAAQLKAHQAAKEAAEPTRLDRLEERVEMAAARDARRAERDQAKLEERQRVEAEVMKEQSVKDTVTNVKAEASTKALNDRVSRVVEDEAARKAERDRRYAERKAKQR
jgi:Family of unknown function (DUF6481)